MCIRDSPPDIEAIMARRHTVPLAALALGTIHALACSGDPASEPTPDAVECYRLKSPDGQRNIEQASDLHYGRLGAREGLWLVCDRNSGECANQVYFIARERLAQARSGTALAVSEAIPIAGPADGWDGFRRRHTAVRLGVLAELRQQIEGRDNGRSVLDLEGITIGQDIGGGEARLFVIAEEPNSLVLELGIEQAEAKPQARLIACYSYEEAANARGGDSNDGLEGIAWCGTPGRFYLVEEGTRPHKTSDPLHFFLAPRFMRCELRDGRVLLDNAWSNEVTRGVRALQTGTTQTLNAVTCIDRRTLAAVDRNGGLVLAVDAPSRTVRPWLNLYDPKLLNLRRRLAAFPQERRMPYVSIEGIAADPNGEIWMVDDPAIPEGFRESVLIRLKRPTPPPSVGTWPAP